jgi:hypothetical protein
LLLAWIAVFSLVATTNYAFHDQITASDDTVLPTPRPSDTNAVNKKPQQMHPKAIVWFESLHKGGKFKASTTRKTQESGLFREV